MNKHFSLAKKWKPNQYFNLFSEKFLRGVPVCLRNPCRSLPHKREKVFITS